MHNKTDVSNINVERLWQWRWRITNVKVLYFKIPRLGKEKQWLIARVILDMHSLVSEEIKPQRDQCLSNLAIQCPVNNLNIPFFFFFPWCWEMHCRVIWDYPWLDDFLFCDWLNHFIFVPHSLFVLIHSSGLWQCPQMVVADVAADFSMKPASRSHYFSTGPFMEPCLFRF